MEKVCEKCKLRNVSELKLCSGCNKVSKYLSLSDHLLNSNLFD